MDEVDEHCVADITTRPFVAAAAERVLQKRRMQRMAAQRRADFVTSGSLVMARNRQLRRNTNVTKKTGSAFMRPTIGQARCGKRESMVCKW
jgi:hypothetical protein